MVISKRFNKTRSWPLGRLINISITLARLTIRKIKIKRMGEIQNLTKKTPLHDNQNGKN